MTNNIQFSSVCGIDIAKSVMQVYKISSDGVVSNKAVKRADFLNEFRNTPPALIGMEACGGSQHWARELQSLGHTVRPMPPKLVKPYVTGLKNESSRGSFHLPLSHHWACGSRTQRFQLTYAGRLLASRIAFPRSYHPSFRRISRLRAI